MAPSGALGGPMQPRPVPVRPPAGMPAGFRWIAVRPGSPPPPRRRRRPLSPTPRYQITPRWGLVDQIVPAGMEADPTTSTRTHRAATATAARATLLVASAVFGLAAAAHLLRYLLLLINRTTLLPPLVANGMLLMGVLVSLAAIAAAIAAAAVMTSWLIARRAAAFAAHGQADPRPEWALWAGCLTPVVNLVWAPVFVVELTRAEQSDGRQRVPVTMWWIAWVISTAISAWATWTSSATEPQAIADNTATTVIAYLAGLAVLLLLWRVLDGFVRRPVNRPTHRWVVVPREAVPEPALEQESEQLPLGVESRPREPAA